MIAHGVTQRQLRHAEAWHCVATDQGLTSSGCELLNGQALVYPVVDSDRVLAEGERYSILSGGGQRVPLWWELTTPTRTAMPPRVLDASLAGVMLSVSRHCLPFQ